MNRLHLCSGLFLLFSVALYQIIEWNIEESPSKNAITTEVLPEFIAESLSSKVYSDTGQLSYIINADRMEHYTALGITHFEAPEYRLYPKNKQPTWKVSAKEGTLYKNNRVTLENRVLILASGSTSLIQEIHGKYLELDLNSNTINSEQTILIQGSGFNMYGSGLIVDLNTNQMTITEHVQTVYKKTQP